MNAPIIKTNGLNLGYNCCSYCIKFPGNIDINFTAHYRIDGTGIHSTDKKYIELSISVRDLSKFGIESYISDPSFSEEQVSYLCAASDEFLKSVKEVFPGVNDFRYNESYNIIINRKIAKSVNEFPNGTIKLVSVENNPVITEPEIEELDKRFCVLCGMPFHVHPLLESNVIFCNFCTMHDIRSI